VTRTFLSVRARFCGWTGMSVLRHRVRVAGVSVPQTHGAVFAAGKQETAVARKGECPDAAVVGVGEVRPFRARGEIIDPDVLADRDGAVLAIGAIGGYGHALRIGAARRRQLPNFLVVGQVPERQRKMTGHTQGSVSGILALRADGERRDPKRSV